jgi:hypothetical protein
MSKVRRAFSGRELELAKLLVEGRHLEFVKVLRSKTGCDLGDHHLSALQLALEYRLDGRLYKMRI